MVRETVEVVIREAHRTDVAVAKSCVAAAFAVYVEPIGRQPAPMLLDFRAEIDAGHVWLAESNGELRGVLVQYETEVGFYIDTVAVCPGAQGLGIGRAILKFGEEEAMRRGYDAVYLCTNVKMAENQILYSHLGYAEYERKRQDGYERVFYRKRLGGGELGGCPTRSS